MEKIENKNLHKLRIQNGELTLDDFKIKGLIGYKVEKSSANSQTELSIKINVED